MPELPDLQVFSKNLKKRLLNKEITAIEIFNQSKVNLSVSGARQKLVGTSLADIVREGKELRFKLMNNNSFNIHLMLNGKFDICESNRVSDLKWKILVIYFADESALVVSDLKGLCKVTFDAVSNNVPDALSSKFDMDYLLKMAGKNTRKNIKAFLIDQSIVRGIGNAYVDEILWKANISPASTVGMIPKERLEILHSAIISILEDAIVNIERISPEIISGEERSFLKVHNPKKKFTDEGDKILVDRIASKITYFTEKQELFK